MGLILAASCVRCGFERAPLRLGATMEQMSGERRSFLHLHRCLACRDVAQVERALGEEPPLACDRCRGPIEAASEYRVVRMKGLALEGHACPRCGEKSLAFREAGQFL